MRRGRKKVENPATARRILAAAEQQFAAKGMAGARTDEIAAAAHANKAMLYYYFGDKRRLHRAVLENLLQELPNGASAKPVPSAGRARDRLLKSVAAYFDFLATHPNYPRLLQREAMQSGRNFDWIVRKYLRPFHNGFIRTIEQGIASGEIRRVDAHHATFTIIGATTSYFAAAPILSEVAGHNLLAPHAVAARKRALLDFVEHGLLRKGPKPR